MKAKTSTPFKTFYPYLVVIIASLSSLFIGSCDKVTETTTYRIKKAVLTSASSIRSLPVGQQQPVDLCMPGKIYVYGDFLLINEVGKGIHIYNNANPTSPKNISFISIDGNVDLAVNNNILYADNHMDLLAFDISDPMNVKLVKRVEDAFPNTYIDQAKTQVLTYKDTVVTEIDRDKIIHYSPGRFQEFYASPALASGNYGQGGSMARFTLQNGHLYAVDDRDLRLFSVNNASNPEFIKTIPLGWGIETIFPYDNKLFIGSTTGMHIYDTSTPSTPQFLSTYSHVTSCDPVIVDGNYAYVTLRSGNFCRSGTNLLQVLDIEDPKIPKLIKSIPMQNPHGLGIYGSDLFICEGAYGLKVFNKQNVITGGQTLQHITNVVATDVIPTQKSLIITGPTGIYQYDFSNPSKLVELSHIDICIDNFYM